MDANTLIELTCPNCGGKVKPTYQQFGNNFAIKTNGRVTYFGTDSVADGAVCANCGTQWAAKTIFQPHTDGRVVMGEVVKNIAQTLNLTINITGDNNTVTSVQAGAGGVAIAGNVIGGISIGNRR